MLRSALSSLALLLVSLCTLPAQESRGTIGGRVVDTTGAVVPNIEVQATNNATGAVASAKTTESGAYTIPFLLPGTYTLSVQVPGFKKYVRDGIPVRVNDVLQLEVSLTVGEVTETVQVEASAPLLETANASLGQVIDQKRITELPIQAGNAFELTLLAPGVSNATDLRLRKAAFNNAPSQITTDGNAQYSNEFMIDGVTNTFSSGNSPRVAFSPPQTAITEFKVQTSAYDASLGHTPGSVVNVNTASGGNAVHGELHHWISNSALDAPTFFQNRGGQRKPVYQDNRYGGSIGGPVVLPKLYDGRNKTFFFYTYEGNKWGGPQTRVTTLPTEAQRRGDFSSLLRLGANYQIYDPATTRAEAGGRFRRDPFPNNVIPESRISPVARAIQQFYPLPNTAGTADGRNNYTVAFKAIEDYYVHLARVDHNFSSNHRAFARVHYDHWTEDKDDIYGNLSHGIILNRTNRGLALDDVLVLGAGNVLNIRYGLTQQDFPERRRSQGFDLSSLGFSPALTSLINPELATFPRVNFSAYSGFGVWETGDGVTASLIHSLVANMTTLVGAHTLRYGTDSRLYRENNNRFQNDVSPVLTFGDTYTRGPLDNSPAAPASLGQDYASFLLGVPTGGNLNRTASYADQGKFFALFVQDDWKVNRRLTMNFGLRYEYESPLTERYDRSVQGFDYDASSPIEAAARAAYAQNPIAELPVSQFRVLGGLTFAGGANGRSLWRGEKNNFMPRIGLALQVAPRTLLRAGYGLFYDTIGTNRSSSNQIGFSQSTPLIPTFDNGLTFVANIANPFPTGLLQPTGAAGGLSTFLGQNISFFPESRVQPYAQRWSVGLQRELPANQLVEASYVGNRGTRINIERNINVVPERFLSRSPERDDPTNNFLSAQVLNPFFGLNSVYGRNISRANLLRPYPQFGNITVIEPTGYAWYHALQVRSEKRFSQGYTFQLAYTWSKSMEATEFLNQQDLRPYESIGSFDRTHRLALSGIFELPFGRGRRFGNSLPKLVDGVLGGWQLNAVVQRQSGPPLGFGNAIFRGNPDDIKLDSSERSVERWFNTAAGFERSPARALVSNYRTFPLRFSGIRGDGQHKWDLSAIKYFRITERVNLQARAEAYNALNHPNFGGPNTGPTDGAFGTVNAQSGTARQFQFALKLTF